MKHCLHCKAIIGANDNYCWSCGKQFKVKNFLQRPEVEYLANTGGKVYCRQCGSGLYWNKESEGEDEKY